jgi:DNA-binding transcriptional ArsR family regulator
MKPRNEYAQIFNSLSHRDRLAITVVLLEAGELCVGDIQKIINQSKGYTSRHIRVMYHDNLIDYTREDRHIFYKIVNPSQTRKILSVFDTDSKFSDELKAYKKLLKKGEITLRRLTPA